MTNSTFTTSVALAEPAGTSQLHYADFAGRRLKLFTILFVVAMRWLFNAISTLGSYLLNQKT
jgi:hypothetical protein